MIHHMSISAQNPQHVAEVLAKIFKGQTVPFPPHPGSPMVLAMDEYGTAIEVYPAGTEVVPGIDDWAKPTLRERDSCAFIRQPKISRFSAVHVAISVPTTQADNYFVV